MTPREEIEPVELRAAVDEAGALWGLRPERLFFVRNFHNLVYRHDGPETSFLRLTAGAHRTPGQVASELELIGHLYRAGLRVAMPRGSLNGRSLESVTTDGRSFAAVLFGEAPGIDFRSASSTGLPPQEFFRAAGRVMGDLHRAGGEFIPSSGFLRFSWSDDRWSEFERWVPRGEREAWRLFDELREWLSGQPVDPQCFGMIHGDFTILNMRTSREGIALFDFDACCRHWYGYEIATFLHYFGGRPKEERMMLYDDLLAGYAEVRELPQRMLDQIPMFAKMRLLHSFLVSAEEWGFTGLTPQQEEYFALRRRLFTAPSAWPPL